MKFFFNFWFPISAFRKKMTSSTFHSLRQLTFPSSNIPLILICSKLTLRLNQLVFKLDNGHFVRTESNRRIVLQRFLSIFLFLVHGIFQLKWFLFNWLYPTNPPVQNWMLVIMAYCFTTVSGTLVGVDQANRLEMETRLLLNSAMKIEIDCKEKGT